MEDMKVMYAEEILREYSEMLVGFLSEAEGLGPEVAEQFKIMLEVTKFAYISKLNIENLMEKFQGLNGTEG